MKTKGIIEFLAVSDSGSFTNAAKALGVSIAHVSRRVAFLEDMLGVKLLLRSTRSVMLTDAGEGFRDRCERIRDELDEIIQSTASSAQKVEGRVKIAAITGSFGDLVVAPTLAKFAKQYPDIDLKIDFSPRHVDIIGEGYDFAIRSGTLKDSSLIARPLVKRTTVAAASPEYLRTFGTPRHPNDLAHHDCILAGTEIWRFQSEDKPLNITVKGRISANYGPALREACEQGVGVAYMASAGYDRALSEGRVVPILQDYWLRGASISLIYADKNFIPLRVSLAMQMLQEGGRKIEMDEEKLLKKIAAHK